MALGCSEYEAWVVDRGAVHPVIQLPFGALDWERVIDGISTASVTLPGRDCWQEFRAAIPWVHEVAIFRNGVLVWAGPITSKSQTAAGPVIYAKDIFAWTKRRRIHADQIFTGVDLSTIFVSMLNDAMAVDNSMFMEWSYALCGVTGDRRVLAQQFRNANLELDELARTALDYTVFNRMVTIGAFDLDLTPIATLTDGSFTDIEVLEVQGDDLVTEATVVGDGVGEAGATIWGTASSTAAEIELYGVHELVYSESSILDTVSAIRNARSRHDLLRRPAVVLSGGTLHPDVDLEINDLQAGRAVNISLSETGEEVVGMYRLDRVVGSTGPEHDRVSISFQPVGTRMNV